MLLNTNGLSYTPIYCITKVTITLGHQEPPNHVKVHTTAQVCVPWVPVVKTPLVET